MKNLPYSAEDIVDYGLLLAILDTYSDAPENDNFFVIKDGIKIIL